jgi:hypothetical protein
MKKITTILTLLIAITSYAQEVKFGKVSQQELEEKFYPQDSTESAAYLYRSRKTYYEYKNNIGFVVINEIHTRTKIYTKEGFKKANKQIYFYKPDKGSNEKVTDIKGYTYNLVNGKIKKTKLSKSNIFDEKKGKLYSVKKLTMPSIKEGTVIEWKYKLTSPYNRTIDDLEFQFDIPVKKLHYEIETPEWFVFNKTPKGYYLIPARESRRGGNISYSERVRSTVRHTSTYRGVTGPSGSSVKSSVQVTKVDLGFNKSTYLAENIPALKGREPFVSSIHNYRGGMKYEISAVNYPNSIPQMLSVSWEDVVKRIYKSEAFGGELKKNSFFKDDLKALLSGLNTDAEKITAILAFVKSKVKWNGYRSKFVDVPVRKAYKEGAGNSASVNLLLTSMLKEAGFNANPVLTSTRINGVPISPTSKGFNYVIASVSLPNKIILLDATDAYSTINVLPFRVMNWNGRLVKDDGTSSWIPLIPTKHALEDNFVNVKLTEDGTIEGMVRTKYTLLNALNYRQRNNPVKEEDIISKLEDRYEIEIDNFKVTNEKDIAKPLARLFKFSSEDLVEEIGGKLYINPLLFFTMETNPFKVEERKYPVDFGFPRKDKNTVTIQIPEGYKVESLPSVLAIGLPDGLGVFKYQVKQVGNKIKVISLMQFNEGVIVPKYYQQLKEFFKQIVEKQTEKIVVVKA